MAGPLEGIKVVEAGLWLAGPACAAILADWGADVTKIEPVAGDPFRGFAWNWDGRMNPPFELDNRGKRSVAVDLATDEGREIALGLLAAADVFVTNYRPGGLARLGLDWPTLHAHNPRLVYASITGYGLRSPDADRAAYDMGAFWSRAGVAASLTLPGEAPPYQRGGMGDHMTGLAAAGGICAALVRRGTTGAGELVETSLLRSGMYLLGTDVNINARTGAPTVPASVRAAVNPLLTGYACADGTWVWLLCLEGDRHWPNVAVALDLLDVLDDPRFVDMAGRRDNSTEVTATIQAAFLRRTRAEWAPILDDAGVWWAPVQHTHDLLDDPVAEAAGGFIDVPLADGTTARMVASPVDFDGKPSIPGRATPELGADTDAVLAELGHDPATIDRLRQAGVIR